MHVVATAGHVDHGKSSLVRALTGTDPDRLAEEKARGLTIDLGFAHLTLASGREAGFVDVPGHARFIRNMLAGVGAIDACLFVVSAVEGWKPQSEEHLRVLELMGVRHGVIALTMADLAGPDGVELAALDVADHVAGTFLASGAVVAVDALRGAGMGELAGAVDAMLAATPLATDHRRPRLWVDRVFTSKGAGTVVTGTLVGGALHVGDAVHVLGRAPVAAPARVRGLQSHGREMTSAGPGRRVAVNLAGVATHALQRGDALVHLDQWFPTRRFDADVRVLAGLDHEVTGRGAYHLHVGSGEFPARLQVLRGQGAITAGEPAAVRVRVATALALTPGDRFVLRETGRAEVVGGGEVTDVDPRRRAAVTRADPRTAADRVVAERGWVDADLLYRLTGMRRAPDVGAFVVSPAARIDAVDVLVTQVRAAGAAGLDPASLGEHQRAVLNAMAPSSLGIESRNGFLVVAGAEPTETHPYLERLRTDLLSPPAPDGVPRDDLRRMVRAGDAAERDGVYFAAEALDTAETLVTAALSARAEGLTMSALREVLGTSRKYAIPLLGLLDARGVTRREGDMRVLRVHD